MKAKDERLNVIRSIISRERVSNQDELIRLLKTEGLNVAQATLSRDLRELGISKSHDGFGYRFRLPASSESSAALKNTGGRGSSGLVISCEFSGNICVIKTHPGHASMISAMMDGKDMDSVAGTVAGDDTVILVVRSRHTPGEVVRELSGIFPDITKKIIE